MTSYKTYWSTWFALLILTVVMILMSLLGIAKGWIVALLLVAMSVKAILIGGNFMHLRYEKATLTLVVAAAIVLTAVALFLGIAPDGVRALNLGSH